MSSAQPWVGRSVSATARVGTTLCAVSGGRQQLQVRWVEGCAALPAAGSSRARQGKPDPWMQTFLTGAAGPDDVSAASGRDLGRVRAARSRPARRRRPHSRSRGTRHIGRRWSPPGPAPTDPPCDCRWTTPTSSEPWSWSHGPTGRTKSAHGPWSREYRPPGWIGTCPTSASDRQSLYPSRTLSVTRTTCSDGRPQPPGRWSTGPTPTTRRRPGR